MKKLPQNVIRVYYFENEKWQKFNSFHQTAEYVSSASLWLFEAAQEASRQTQTAIGKAADKATDTIKEFGHKLETK